MAAQLATQGYRIAKSWQYQENLPEPALADGVAGDNNNSFFVSTSLNPGRSIPPVTSNAKSETSRNPAKKVFAILKNEDLHKPLLFPESRCSKNKIG